MDAIRGGADNLIGFPNTISAWADAIRVSADAIRLPTDSLVVFSNAIRIFARNYIVRRISSRNIWKKIQKLHFEHKALVSKPLLR